MTLDHDTRMSVDPTCENAGYANQTGGNEVCGIYIAVQCGEAEEICAYKLELTVYNDTQIVPKTMPRYITWDQEYI